MNRPPQPSSFTEHVASALWDFVSSRPKELIITALSIGIALVIFRKIISPYLFNTYKNLLCYRYTLRQLKQALEENYEEYHWNDSDFCKAYLALYAAYREMRTVAKRDVRGRIDPADRRWREFDEIHTFDQ
ncbi:unnamed protein product [Toxocara canis]|nr:unnamed protein product [Toxocara canis]